MADVVAVSDISKFEPLQVSEAFLERHEIGQRLAWMLEVAQCIDDRNAGVLGHFRDGLMCIRAQNNDRDPTLEIARHIGQRLALAERRLCLVYKDGIAARRVDGRLKGEARAQRRLLK